MIALYSLLPHFSAELLQSTFSEICRLTLSKLDSYLYIKLSNSDHKFHSPYKASVSRNLEEMRKNNPRVKINYAEKVSQRLEHLRKDDSLQDLDVVEHFWQMMQEV